MDTTARNGSQAVYSSVPAGGFRGRRNIFAGTLIITMISVKAVTVDFRRAGHIRLNVTENSTAQQGIRT